jgi:hypothetical protein
MGPVAVTAFTSPTSRLPTTTPMDLARETSLVVSLATSLLLTTGALTEISCRIATVGSLLAAGFGASSGFGGSACACIGTGATSVKSSRLGSGIDALYQ